MCDKIAKHAGSQEESEGGREGRFYLVIQLFPFSTLLLTDPMVMAKMPAAHPHVMSSVLSRG